ncbi:MAG TPA: hypothetical protein RMH85_14760 [Polyangiaceae bacterium LLY-WYZ-15_(1-7)]|nr:hypothetical protein [Sandaracinus sp.]HJK94351.1 hypothetical protein [Polyangiaceae bacterium LLY-WYZ-15_(1-7)]MBJ74779.1 hypothetical protein [Sandaracinus sp.]HJL02761.1 hypothetical protein [Polyangiaceae bacterium LLY-WYZ-15_(1-7)]HJL09761.1 hypothetical protein [Polyangiaceae bacterium LLY-WYZ-15_(1-7)]
MRAPRTADGHGGRTGEVRCKGSAITSRMRFLEERGGDAARAAVLERLSPAFAERLEAGVLKNAWVPFDLFLALNEAIDAELGQGDLALCREMGRFGARLNLPTVYRLFYKVGSLAFILRRAPRVWAVHYSSGKLVVDTGRDWAKLRVERFRRPHRALWLSVLGWAEASAELSGTRLREAELLTAPESLAEGACEMVLRW